MIFEHRRENKSCSACHTESRHTESRHTESRHTESRHTESSAWDLKEFGPSRKILRTVNISRPTVIPTGRNAQHNSLHTLL